jgi:hypothetical protein
MPDETGADIDATELLTALIEEHKAVRAFMLGLIMGHPTNEPVQHHHEFEALIEAHDGVSAVFQRYEDREDEIGHEG